MRDPDPVVLFGVRIYICSRLRRWIFIRWDLYYDFVNSAAAPQFPRESHIPASRQKLDEVGEVLLN